MNKGFNFHIGEQHAGRDIYHIIGDIIINQNSPTDDVLKIIRIIQDKVCELDIDERYQKEILKSIENVKFDLEDKEPDKKSICESIKNTNKVLKEAKATGDTLKDIGILIGKVALWLGTTRAQLGWI